MIKPQTLEETGNSSNKFLKAFIVSDAKIGKTTYIAASALGALPEQEFGLVSDPSCLHILGFDEGTVDGLLEFLKTYCRRPDCTKMTIWNLAPIAKAAMLGKGWDMSLYNNIMAVLGEINKLIEKDKTKTHAVVASSFTGMGMALKGALAGKPTEEVKGAGMNQAKWDALNSQLQTLRAEAQRDNKHMFWEGHIQTKFSAPAEGEKPGATEETVGVPGGEGRNWAANTGEVMRLRREPMQYKYPDGTASKIDKVFLDTKPSLDFVSGGRGMIALAPKEYDLALVCKKLGKQVGGYKKP